MAKYKTRLKSMADCRRYLANLANKLDDGAIEEGRARTLTYIISILTQTIEKADLETRLTELEKTVQEQKTNGY